MRSQSSNLKSLTYNRVTSFAWAKDTCNNIPKDSSAYFTLIATINIIHQWVPKFNDVLCEKLLLFKLPSWNSSGCPRLPFVKQWKKNQEINTLYSLPQAIHGYTDLRCRWYYVPSNCLFSRQKISYANYFLFVQKQPHTSDRLHHASAYPNSTLTKQTKPDMVLKT